MNLASWIILAVVAAIVVLALRATFSGRAHGSCCGKDADSAHCGCDGNGNPSCVGCAGCASCPSSGSALMPTITYEEQRDADGN